MLGLIVKEESTGLFAREHSSNPQQMCLVLTFKRTYISVDTEKVIYASLCAGVTSRLTFSTEYLGG